MFLRFHPELIFRKQTNLSYDWRSVSKYSCQLALIIFGQIEQHVNKPLDWEKSCSYDDNPQRRRRNCWSAKSFSSCEEHFSKTPSVKMETSQEASTTFLYILTFRLPVFCYSSSAVLKDYFEEFTESKPNQMSWQSYPRRRHKMGGKIKSRISHWFHRFNPLDWMEACRENETFKMLSIKSV